jgi:type VI secretion system protein ImpK
MGNTWMSDNPFAEPDDSDRTVIRPAPGGRRAFMPPPPPAPAPAVSPPEPRLDATFSSASDTPLLAAAAPLLLLLARLRNTLRPPVPGNLRDSAIRELRNFEAKTRDARLPAEQVRPAHYALCASLDDVVLATPWGSQSEWTARSLVSTLHQEVRSGERFFDLLGQMRQSPETFLPVLELMYFCLSLGYMGRYRLSPRGPAEIDRLREEVHALIRRQAPSGDAELSPHWQGVAAPYRPRRFALPLWVAASGAAGILALLYAVFSISLAGQTDQLYRMALAAKPAVMPRILRMAPVVPPPPPVISRLTLLDRLRKFLAPEIAAGQVSVLGTLNAAVVRINNSGLFASGSATIQPGALPLLGRIGKALARDRGRVLVIGYTDNQPIHSLRFPNNLVLSQDRAKAAAAVLDRSINDRSRIIAEGKGPAAPIATNATPQGRAMNRRIEIVLQRGGP